MKKIALLTAILLLLTCFTACKKPEEPDLKAVYGNKELTAEELAAYQADYITVASYNVNCFTYGKGWDAIVAEIKKVDPDIIGLQELDNNTERSGQGNQAQLLAEKLGYDYWYYAPTLPQFQGGQYGHGVVSKFPIVNSEYLEFDVNPEETRNYERHEIRIGDQTLAFYNTHLCLGKKGEQVEQLAEITARMEQDTYAVLTGDLNLKPDRFTEVINGEKLVMLNGGPTYETWKYTYPQGAKPTTPIDNIIVTKNIEYYWEEENKSGIIVNYADCSDHNMVYTYLKLKA